MRELGTGEMAPQLRARAAFPEGSSSSPRTLDKLLTTPVTRASGDDTSGL